MTEQSAEYQYHYDAFIAMGMDEQRARFAAAVSVGQVDGDVITDVSSVPESQLPDAVRIELDKQ